MDEKNFEAACAEALRVKEYCDACPPFPEMMASLFLRDYLAGQDIDPSIEALATGKRYPRTNFDILQNLSSRLVRDGQRLPPRLQHWTADVVAGLITRPTRGEMRNGKRDFWLPFCVWWLERNYPKMDETRQRESKTNRPHRSACDAAAKAFGITYDATEKIWTKNRRKTQSIWPKLLARYAEWQRKNHTNH